MPRSKSYILEAFMETPWAILPAKLAVLEGIVSRYVAGDDLNSDEINTTLHGASSAPRYRQVGSVAVLPLFGTILPRANLMTAYSGATSAETFGKEFAKLVNNPEIGAIVIDVNSPGGQVGGVEELSKQIFDARGSKPIVAVANHLMASAAYWIGTSADEVVVTPSGQVGSVGVFAAHADYSQAYEMAGIDITLISAGKYKTEANPYEKLGEVAREAIQEAVNETYQTFLNAIARNRDLKPALVETSFGEGRMVSAQKALSLSMVDRIATLDETVNRLLSAQVGAVYLPQKSNLPQENPLSASTSAGAEQTSADIETEKQASRLRERISQIRSEYDAI